MSLASFFASPQNRTGISIWIGTAITALVQYFVAHQTLSFVDLLGLILGFLKIVEPETTVTLAQLEGIITDVKEMITKESPGALAKITNDTSGLIEAIDK